MPALAKHFELAANRSELVQMIFPEADELQDLSDVVKLLCGDPSWYCKAYSWPDGQRRSLLLSLRYILPGDDLVSLALGMADFDTMPRTRRAPYPTLVIRVGPPGVVRKIVGQEQSEHDRPRLDGRIAVYLGDAPPLRDDPEHIVGSWNRTKQDVAQFLKDDPLRDAAHPHLTFSLPWEATEHLQQLLGPEGGWNQLKPLERDYPVDPGGM